VPHRSLRCPESAAAEPVQVARVEAALGLCRHPMMTAEAIPGAAPRTRSVGAVARGYHLSAAVQAHSTIPVARGPRWIAAEQAPRWIAEESEPAAN